MRKSDFKVHQDKNMKFFVAALLIWKGLGVGVGDNTESKATNKTESLTKNRKQNKYW